MVVSRGSRTWTTSRTGRSRRCKQPERSPRVAWLAILQTRHSTLGIARRVRNLESEMRDVGAKQRRVCLARERREGDSGSGSALPLAHLSICTFSAAQLWLVDRDDAQVDSPEMLWISEASCPCSPRAKSCIRRNCAVRDATEAVRSWSWLLGVRHRSSSSGCPVTE
jgi:hypothetical protein